MAPSSTAQSLSIGGYEVCERLIKSTAVWSEPTKEATVRFSESVGSGRLPSPCNYLRPIGRVGPLEEPLATHHHPAPRRSSFRTFTSWPMNSTI
ncbi:hypothetical protein CISG_04035 [Coccidioides immitis RMSCC 3703]|uniref:Uncharacterized protein n=1 Tax=Coccidioides immitis RMSCC 3703 TaxID=454286 RepID=A0A0J8QNT4_COCIT|nr:hypothetical protein CISG_04035 [Coccidioides immitis RMSCC 3703]